MARTATWVGHQHEIEIRFAYQISMMTSVHTKPELNPSNSNPAAKFNKLSLNKHLVRMRDTPWALIPPYQSCNPLPHASLLLSQGFTRMEADVRLINSLQSCHSLVGLAPHG